MIASVIACVANSKCLIKVSLRCHGVEYGEGIPPPQLRGPS